MRSKYGLSWRDDFTPLEIEFTFIRQGGHITLKGKKYGEGLFHHYREVQRLLWPDDDDHRWSDMALRAIVNNEITVFMGSSDSNKTYSISRFVLCDWWAFPDNTLWMVSSTEMRGAELRIWGKLKELFNRARSRWPDLPGTILESKHAFTTEKVSDDGSEARLMTKGLIFIPCKSNNKWLGMGCFPAGQMVDTPSGRRSIETLKVGDFVIGAIGKQKIKRVSVRTAPKLARVTMSDGRFIDCTPEHPFLTELGWKRAIDIPLQTRLISPHEALQNLRERNSTTSFLGLLLRQEMQNGVTEKAVRVVRKILYPIRPSSCFLLSFLRGFMEVEPARYCQKTNGGKGLCCNGEKGKRNNNGQSQGAVASKKEHGAIASWISKGSKSERDSGLRGKGSGAQYESSGETHVCVVSRSQVQPLRQNREMFKVASGPYLLSGFRILGYKTGCGGGWALPQSTNSEKEGCGQNSFSKESRVVSVEILRTEGDSRYDKGAKGYRVHNLEIENHPSYSVNSVIVHNSYAGIKPTKNGRLGHAGDEVSTMESSFLDAYSNWYGKENFKGIMSGNPIETEDPLCTAGEPVEGWDNWVDTGKTQEWRSKWYNAWVVAYDGRDSPNLDFPGLLKPKYPYLIGEKKLKAVEASEGKDSPLYWMQCVGKPLPGAAKLKVVTKQICEQGRAFDDVTWEGTETVSVAACDAAYGGVGGDRCVLIRGEFGKEVGGRTVFAFHQPVLVPVSVKNLQIPEEQIAAFCRDWCNGFNIPPERFFFDARATMAVAFSRLWSPNVNAVDFGGPATKRPISNNEFVWEGETQTKRLKRADEQFSKFVSELWFAVRYAIISGQIRQLPRDVAAEGFKRIWRFTKGSPPRMEVETKAEMKLRTSQSPDLFDSAATLIEGARRLGFTIENIPDPKSTQSKEDDYLEKELDKYRRSLKTRRLSYS